MSPGRQAAEAVDELPPATERRQRWRFQVVWVVPLVAVIVAGLLVYDRVRDLGPALSIQFEDVSGLQVGQTEIKYRGVPIGKVTAIDLAKDHQHASVEARLRRSAAPLAQTGALFWIVRPELKLPNVTGLETVMTGPEIQMLPGRGAPRTDFVGLESAPPAAEHSGLRIIVRTDHLRSLRAGSPVFYRGVEVGSIQEPELGPDATTVDLHVLIEPRYAGLIRSGSKFWDVSGIELRGGLFRGVQLKLDSLTSLVSGGIAFATPTAPGSAPVASGSVFALYQAPRPEWLTWSPRIDLPPPPHP